MEKTTTKTTNENVSKSGTTQKQGLKKKRITVITIMVLLEVFLLSLIVGIFFVDYIPDEDVWRVKTLSGYTYDVADDYVAIVDCRLKDKNITVPDSFLGKPVKVIGKGAFIYLPVENVTLGKDVVVIEDGAFCGCTELKSVGGNAQIESIGASAFSGCSQLSSIAIGTSIVKIDQYAFWNCNGLIGKEPFANQEHLVIIGEYALDFEGGLEY